MGWTRATVEEVRKVVLEHLAHCNAEQVETFRRYRVEPYVATISRYGQLETAVVVAHKGDEAMYWEDVEEGFNTSRLGVDRMLLNHSCNQDDLGTALTRWFSGEGPKLLPAEPLTP